MLTPPESYGSLREPEDEPHGGRLKQARLCFPQAPEPFIDLSTGINPLAYPVPALSPSAWTRLPEPEDIAGLEAIAARAYGARDRSLVAALPGTQILISLLPSLLAPEGAAIFAPTYGEYARIFRISGRAVREVGKLAELADAPCAVVVNPNNPDGRRVQAAELLALVKARRGKGLLVVDESFADLDDEGLSLAPYLPLPGVLVLRSLSKSYGLGGLRLGFALGTPELAMMLHVKLGPWPISGVAIDIGSKALADQAWLVRTRHRLSSDVARLDALLSGAGLQAIGGTLLFRLISSESAGPIFQRLGEAGILVRSFASHPDWLRFGIPGDEAAWDRLSAVLG